MSAMGNSLDTQQKTFSDSLVAMEMKLTKKIELMSTHAAGGATGSSETLHEMEDSRRNGDNRDPTQRTPAESEKERHGPTGL